MLTNFSKSYLPIIVLIFLFISVWMCTRTEKEENVFDSMESNTAIKIGYNELYKSIKERYRGQFTVFFLPEYLHTKLSSKTLIQTICEDGYLTLITYSYNASFKEEKDRIEITKRIYASSNGEISIIYLERAEIFNSSEFVIYGFRKTKMLNKTKLIMF